MAMLVHDDYWKRFYFGTCSNDMTIRRSYIKPEGGNPLYDWLKDAVRYFIVRTALARGHPEHLITPRSMPAEYVDENALRPPGNYQRGL